MPTDFAVLIMSVDLSLSFKPGVYTASSCSLLISNHLTLGYPHIVFTVEAFEINSISLISGPSVFWEHNL